MLNLLSSPPFQDMVNVLYRLIAVLILVHKFAAPCDSSENKLTVVTRFEGIETYYRNIFDTLVLRQTGETPRPVEESDLRLLCNNLFKSRHFLARQEHWVELYPTADVVNSSQSGTRAVFYGYRERKVFVQDEEKIEFLLTCFSRPHKFGGVKAYHFSPIYNVNSVKSSYPLAGRFIFEYDSENRLILHGLAEGPALSKMKNFTLDEREQKYISQKRPLDEVGIPTMYDDGSDDPVCQLEPGEKLRLCSTVLSSPEFRKKAKFVPAPLNVQTECVPIQISFRNTMWEKIGHKDKIFKEQAIGCRTTNLDQRERQIVYYISRGCGANEVYVYKSRGGQIFVKDWMTRVSVVKY